MLKWWKRRVYRNHVLSNVMAMMLMVGDDEGAALQKDAGIANAIRGGFDDDQPIEVIATHIAAIFIRYSIEQCDDIAQIQAVEQAVSDWSMLPVEEQRAVKNSLLEEELVQDFLITRCQWMLMMAQDFLVEEKINIQDFRILKDGVFGALKGETEEYRRKARIEEIFADAHESAKELPTDEERDAYELGQDVAESMTDDLDDFIETRFGHLESAYLKVLENGLSDAKMSTDHSPIIVARVDFDLFRENVEVAKNKMLDEIGAEMVEWRSVMATLESDSYFEKLVKFRVEGIVEKLEFAGLDLFEKHQEEIVAADNVWRQKFPEQALKEPLHD